MIFAQENSRVIPKEDKTFALSARAKKAIAEKGKENVINAIVGALLDDKGDLCVMKVVEDELRNLPATDYFEYAPIKGIPAFREAVKKDLFRDYVSKRFVEVIASPGGTGTIRNSIANYSQRGDTVLTSDWYWAPYNSLCQEQERKLETFAFFNEAGEFNIEGLSSKIFDICDRQGRLVILLNTPSHNPTGYTLSDPDWDSLIAVLNDERLKGSKIALVVDIAYIDFAGDLSVSRGFLPKLDQLNDNVLALIGYSASKSFAAYGTRTGALVCMAPTEEIAEEFVKVAEFSSRNTWSNCNHSGQAMVANIVLDDKKLAMIDEERRAFRDMLLRRGHVFEAEAKALGLNVVPFKSGFFCCIACDNADQVSAALEEKGVFVLPLKMGVRVSIASISEEKCIAAARAIREVIK